MQQQAGFIPAVRGDAAGQVAVGDGFRKAYRLAQRTGYRAHDIPANHAADSHAEQGDRNQQQAIGSEVAINLRPGAAHLAVLDSNKLLHFRFVGLLQVEGVGHHLLNRALTVVILHGL